MAIMAEDAKLKRGYKQTEVGVIPEDWDQKLLYEGIKLLSGYHVLASHCNTEGRGMPYITGPADFPGGIIKNSKFTEKPTTICRKNDILVTVKGSGAGTIVLADNEYCISRQLMAIRVTEWHTAYVYAFLRKDASLFGAAATGLIPGLSRSDILNKYVPIPPLPEQHAIATALSDVDALITSLDKLIAKKRDVMQATMQQLLTGKVRLPGFSGEWEMKKLGDFFEMRPSRTRLSDAEMVTIIRMEDISESGNVINKIAVPFSSVKPGLTFFERNDVLVAKITPCFENGKGACLDKLETNCGFGSTEFHVLRAKKNAVPRYIFYQTQLPEFRKRLEAEMVGTAGQQRVPAQAIIDYPLPVYHSRDEQQAIAAILSDMDAEIAALEQKREKTYMVKQGMMQELLSGKTRLV